MASGQSSTESRIEAKARADLVVTESIYQGERTWVLKDPVALKYYQLKPPEYRVFQALDGSASIGGLRSIVATEFPDLRPTKEDLQNLVISFQRNGLLVADASRLSVALQKQRAAEIRGKLIGLLSSIVSLKFPGVDPDRFLSWLYPKIRWLFSPIATLLFFFLALAALCLVLSNFGVFYSRLPKFQQFFGFNNLLYLGIVLILTKLIHELGHGLMCKHFGGECHEIGLMLLVFTPAMYCNTSDSWVLPNKWHRMAIGAAGMYVEVVMASVCTFIWWYTHPNWLHFLALNVMFLSSVSTLMFNANPLLRYDGYFILADFLEISNLSQKSKISLTNWLRVSCLGMPPVNSRMLPEKRREVFALYSVASFIYRWFVMLVIFWFVCQVLEPYGMQIIGHLLILISVTGMIVVPLFKLLKFFVYPGRMREIKKKNVVLSLIATSAAIGFLCFYPIDHNVFGSFVIAPNDAQRIFVQQPGKILEIRAWPGDRVKKGDVVAILDNSEVITEIRQLETQLNRMESDYDAYRLLQGSFQGAERIIGELNAEIVKAKRQIQIREKQLEQLTLRANRDGVVIPPPNLPKTAVANSQLGQMSGTPFDAENAEAFLPSQSLFCYVGEPNDFKAFVAIEERNIKLVQADLSAKLLCHQFRTSFVRGKVVSVSTNELDYLPREISQTNGGYVAVEPQLDGTEKPILKMYEAVVTLDEKSAFIRSGFYGRAKIKVGKAPIGTQMYRYVMSLVNFR